MSKLNRKEDLIDLFKQPDFVDLLFINSEQEFDEKPQSFRSEHYQYHETELDEHTSGVDLFTTPRKSIAGGDPWATWLEVVKLYGDHECPFRVRALEYAPWGQDVESSNVGDYKTLGQAMDAALNIHEHGSVEINVIEVNEELGRYVKSDPRIRAPEHEGDFISDLAQAVNQLVVNHTALQGAKKLAEAREREVLKIIHREAWKAKVPLEDARPIIAHFSKLVAERKLGGSTEMMRFAASVISNELFAGEAKLIAYTSDALNHLYDQSGAVFAVVDNGDGKYTYLSAECGIQEGFEDARACTAALLEKQYEKERVEPGMYWLDGELWEIDFKDLSVCEEKLAVIQEPDEFDPYQPDDYLIHLAMREAVTPYREELKKKMEPMIRAREAKVELDRGLSPF